MAELFADLPEALENTVEIAGRCSWYTQTRKPILPRFTGESDDPEAAVQAEADELARQAREGLKKRLETAGLAEAIRRNNMPNASNMRSASSPA
ncbi:DNA polymerase III subunit alpha [Brucella ceti TE28753-12]|nr:DNA polymerase III subunit alpha [Brucella ceti TE28753-12]